MTYQMNSGLQCQVRSSLSAGREAFVEDGALETLSTTDCGYIMIKCSLEQKIKICPDCGFTRQTAQTQTEVQVNVHHVHLS